MKKALIIVVSLIAVVCAVAPWLDNQKIHDQVLADKARTDRTINEQGELMCDYHVDWVPFGRFVSSCEGGYFVTMWGQIL